MVANNDSLAVVCGLVPLSTVISTVHSSFLAHVVLSHVPLLSYTRFEYV